MVVRLLSVATGYSRYDGDTLIDQENNLQMATISIDGKPVDSNTWTPPVLGTFRKYQFVSNVILAAVEVAGLDAIAGLPLGSNTSGGLALGAVATLVGSSRFRNSNYMRRRALRIHVARLNKRASNLAELERENQQNSRRYRHQARSARRSLRLLLVLDSKVVPFSGKTTALTPKPGVTVSV
jgi:hypothetical protein